MTAPRVNSPRRFVRVALALGPMLAIHLALFAIPFVEFTLWSVLLMLAVSRFIGLGVTAGFHRCLTHGAFRTSRWFRFLLVAAGCAALQKGPLWWVAQHRLHHKHSDTDADPHSPVTGNFFHAHFGWLFTTDPTLADARIVRDLAKYPELVWLERLWVVPGVLLAFACYAILGWTGLIYGYCLTAVLVLHVTFAVNSVARVRSPAVRHQRRQPEQRGAGHPRVGRRVAQQPPPRAALRASRLRVVRVRRNLSVHPRAVEVRRGVGREVTERGCDDWQNRKGRAGRKRRLIGPCDSDPRPMCRAQFAASNRWWA